MAEEEAGERTEQATARHIERAREASPIPVSREAPTLAVLASFALMLTIYGPTTARTLTVRLAALLSPAHPSDPLVELRAAAAALLHAAAPYMIAAIAAGAVAIVVQTGGAVSTASLMPDLARLSPSRGLSRLFSFTSVIDVGKSLLQISVAGFVLSSLLSTTIPLLREAVLLDPVSLLARTGAEVLRVLMALLGTQAAVAAFDILRVRITDAGALRMTRQQVRDEHKETDGDPQIKARIRRLRAQRARKRMMQAVPTATVIVTNPTHYAVALAYERGSTGAPRVVAKGVDSLALRIREIGQQHRVPLVVNPMLARALYPVELEAEIPQELFQAVADIIAHIWGLRRTAQ